MKENMILEVKHLEKRFKDFHLRDIGFSLPEGYIMGFIGANGAGKTTTLALILNLLHKDAGSVHVFGLDHVEAEIEIKEQIGVIFDSVYLVSDWKVSEAAAILRPFYRLWNDGLFSDYCHRFHLPGDKKIKELSRGMQVKLSLAIALSYDAKLLLLDEPTSGLDPLSREEIREILQEYIEDGRRSVLFSTHITGDLERIADYITFIHQGRLMFTGTKDAFTAAFSLVKGAEERIAPALRAKIIGLRSYAGGFEGLIRSQDVPAFREGFVLEAPTIEDIMVYVGKEN